MPGPRKGKRRTQADDTPEWESVQYPQLKANQEGISAEEIAQREARARLLVSGGLAAIEGWLLSDPTPEERKNMRPAREAPSGPSQRLLDAFG